MRLQRDSLARTFQFRSREDRQTLAGVGPASPQTRRRETAARNFNPRDSDPGGDCPDGWNIEGDGLQSTERFPQKRLASRQRGYLEHREPARFARDGDNMRSHRQVTAITYAAAGAVYKRHHGCLEFNANYDERAVCKSLRSSAAAARGPGALGHRFARQ